MENKIRESLNFIQKNESNQNQPNNIYQINSIQNNSNKEK